ncbi:MAG: transposase [Candidatus Cloacimonadota bacterium]|nr:transposase [Candidatus Cloacimonadota bacterium]
MPKKSDSQLLSYKHRLFPNSSQKSLLDHDIFAGNQVFNIVLNLLFDQYLTYSSTRDFYNDFLLHIHQIPQKQIKFHWMNNTEIDRKVRQALSSRDLYCPLDVMQGERKIAVRAFKDAMKKDKSMPKYRKSNQLHGSFGWANARTKLSSRSVNLSKRLGDIKMKRERDFPENSILKTVRIKKENNQYFAIFSLQLDLKKIDESSFSEIVSVGMDTNNGHLDFSDGDKIKYGRSLTMKELQKRKKNRKLVKELLKKEKLQQKQSKREEISKNTKSKLGKNYYKTQQKINKISIKEKNRRKNLLDKTSNEVLSKAFDVLFIENLAVQQMTAKNNKSKSMSKANNKQMRKNILNFSYSTLHRMLEYKAMLSGRLVISVDPRNTTKMCSECSSIKKMKLSDRVYDCPVCGMKMDRDLNSAKNIEARGLNLFAEINPACLIA